MIIISKNDITDKTKIIQDNSCKTLYKSKINEDDEQDRISYRSSKLNNYIELQISDLESTLHQIQKKNTINEIKESISHTYSIFIQMEPIFKQLRASFLYQKTKKLINCFSIIFLMQMDHIERPLKTLKSKNNLSKFKIQDISMKSECLSSANLDIQPDDSNNDKQKKIKYLGGVHLYNEQYNRHVETNNDRLKRKQKTQMSKSNKKIDQKNKFNQQVLKQIYENTYDITTPDQIALFMSLNVNKYSNELESITFQKQLEDIANFFKQSQQSALQFLDKSRSDFSLLNFSDGIRDVITQYRAQKQTQIIGINDKLKFLFQLINKKLQQKQTILNQKIEQITKLEKKSKRIKKIDDVTQTTYSFTDEIQLLHAKINELTISYQSLKKFKEKQNQIQQNILTKNQQHVSSMNRQIGLLKSQVQQKDYFIQFLNEKINLGINKKRIMKIFNIYKNNKRSSKLRVQLQLFQKKSEPQFINIKQSRTEQKSDSQNYNSQKQQEEQYKTNKPKYPKKYQNINRLQNKKREGFNISNNQQNKLLHAQYSQSQLNSIQQLSEKNAESYKNHTSSRTSQKQQINDNHLNPQSKSKRKVRNLINTTTKPKQFLEQVNSFNHAEKLHNAYNVENYIKTSDQHKQVSVNILNDIKKGKTHHYSASEYLNIDNQNHSLIKQESQDSQPQMNKQYLYLEQNKMQNANQNKKIIKATNNSIRKSTHIDSKITIAKGPLKKNSQTFQNKNILRKSQNQINLQQLRKSQNQINLNQQAIRKDKNAKLKIYKKDIQSQKQRNQVFPIDNQNGQNIARHSQKIKSHPLNNIKQTTLGNFYNSKFHNSQSINDILQKSFDKSDLQSQKQNNQNKLHLINVKTKNIKINDQKYKVKNCQLHDQSQNINVRKIKYSLISNVIQIKISNYQKAIPRQEKQINILCKINKQSFSKTKHKSTKSQIIEQNSIYRKNEYKELINKDSIKLKFRNKVSGLLTEQIDKIPQIKRNKIEKQKNDKLSSNKPLDKIENRCRSQNNSQINLKTSFYNKKKNSFLSPDKSNNQRLIQFNNQKLTQPNNQKLIQSNNQKILQFSKQTQIIRINTNYQIQSILNHEQAQQTIQRWQQSLEDKAIKIALKCHNLEQFKIKIKKTHLKKCGQNCIHLQRYMRNFTKYKTSNRETMKMHIQNVNNFIDKNSVQGMNIRQKDVNHYFPVINNHEIQGIRFSN